MMPFTPFHLRVPRHLSIALAALLVLAFSVVPRAAQADSDCRFTSGEATFYPQGNDDGLGFATAEEECHYLVTAGYALEGATKAVGYLAIKSNHNGCLRGRRSHVAKGLAKGWRAWGTADDISISGRAGTHAVIAWSKKDENGKTTAVIYYYSQGVYRTHGLQNGEVDHLTFCQIVNQPIVVPRQFIALDAPLCCGDPYPRTPGVPCTYRPQILPGRQCRGPM